MQILVCQMGGCASAEAREFKIAATKKLICKYNINLCLFMELNFNWKKLNSSANLASWFHKEEREKYNAPLLTTLRSLTSFLAYINWGVW